MSDLSLEYVAGLFDGEGSVTFRIDKRGCATFQLSVTNTHRAILDRLAVQFGGSVQTQPPATKGVFRWYVTGSKAELFAREIVLFSIIKKDQLQLFLEARERFVIPRHLRKTIGGRVSNEEQVARKNLEMALRNMKIVRPSKVF